MGMEEAEFKEIEGDEPAAAPPPAAKPSGAPAPAGKPGFPKKYSAAQRYQSTSKPPSKAAARVKMLLIFGLPVLIAAIVVAGFVIKSKGGVPVWLALLRDRLGILPREVKKPKPEVRELSEMDQRYNNALAIRFRAQFYVKTVVRRADETPESLAAVTPEKAEEIVKELTEWLEKMTASIDDVAAVADETNKPEGTRKSDADNLQASEELQNHTKFRKELAGILADWKVHRDRKKGIVAAPPQPPKPVEPPKPVDPPKEPPKIEVPKRPHPWASFKPGAWVRHRVTVKGGEAPHDALADYSLSEVTEALAKVKVEELGKEGAVSSRVTPHEISDPTVKAVAAEKVKVGEVEVACVVLESSPLPGVTTKAWIAQEGPAARLGEVKTDTGRGVLTATLIEEEARTIGDREVKCLKIYYEGKAGDLPVRQQAWFSEQVPGFVVRRVTTTGEGAEQIVLTHEVVDFGDDASKRPALAAKKEEPKPEVPKPEAVKPDAPKPDAPKPVEKTPADLLAEADKAYADGTTLFLEVRKAMASPPEEAEAVKALLAKVEEALALYGKAKETYAAHKDKASEPAVVEERSGRIDKTVPLLQNYADGLKSRLK